MIIHGYTIPDSIKVGAYVYRIEEMTRAESYDDRKYGIFSKNKMLISIDTSVSMTEVCNTFLHEILHTLFDHHSLLDSDDEERTVRSMALGLMMVFVDNPWVLDFLGQSQKK